MISTMSVVKSPLKSDLEEGSRFLMSGGKLTENNITLPLNDALKSSFQPISAYRECERAEKDAGHQSQCPTLTSADGKGRNPIRSKKALLIPELDNIQANTEGSKLRPPRANKMKMNTSSKHDDEPSQPRGASSPRRSSSPSFESTLRRTKTPDILEEFWIQDLRGRMRSNEALQASCCHALDLPLPIRPVRTTEKRSRSESPVSSSGTNESLSRTAPPATTGRISPSAFLIPGEVDLGDVYLLRDMPDMAACHKSAQFGFSWWGIRESGFLRVELEKGKHLKPYVTSAPKLDRSQSMPSTVAEPLITVIDMNTLKRQSSADSTHPVTSVDRADFTSRNDMTLDQSQPKLSIISRDTAEHSESCQQARDMSSVANATGTLCMPLSSPRAKYPTHHSSDHHHHTKDQIPWYKKHHRWETELQNHRNVHYSTEYPPPPLPSPRPRQNSLSEESSFDVPRDRSGSFSEWQRNNTEPHRRFESDNSTSSYNSHQHAPHSSPRVAHHDNDFRRHNSRDEHSGGEASDHAPRDRSGSGADWYSHSRHRNSAHNRGKRRRSRSRDNKRRWKR